MSGRDLTEGTAQRRAERENGKCVCADKEEWLHFFRRRHCVPSEDRGERKWRRKRDLNYCTMHENEGCNSVVVHLLRETCSVSLQCLIADCEKKHWVIFCAVLKFSHQCGTFNWNGGNTVFVYPESLMVIFACQSCWRLIPPNQEVNKTSLK